MKALTTAIFLAMTTPALADTVTIEYPKAACVNIHGSDISAPGGDSMYYLFELHCEDASGNHKVFIANWASAAAFLGFSRAGIPDQLVLVPKDVTGLVVRE